MNAAEFVSRLGANAKPTKTAQGWQCRCPAHEDGKASLSVSDAGDRTLIHCHAGCSPQAICEAKGVKTSDLFHGKPHRNGFNIAATYDYRDEHGELLLQAVRYEPKTFKQRRPDATAPDGWKWTTAGVRRVLYRLPEIIRDVQRGLPIIVCEGEKDVAALVKLGFSATCNVGGAGKWRDEYSDVLRGVPVFIIADKDAPGRAHAQTVASSLQGKASSVAVLELPDFNGRTVKDAADFIAAGATSGDVQAQLEAASEWKPEATPQAAERDLLPWNEDAPNESPSVPAWRYLFDLKRPEASDPAELIGNRFLCRRGGLLFVGQTGVGKSSLSMQAMILWALGRECFGLIPVRPLKSVLIQAENDDGDLAEFRDGVAAGLKLTPDEVRQVRENLIVHTEATHTGAKFCQCAVRPLLELHRPDLVWIDPALSFLGGEANSQKDVGAFLRNGLNPLLQEFDCAAIVVTHTAKPGKGQDRSEWKAGDFAYLGLGSVEWANWARAVINLRSIGSHDVFELQAPKRGNRLGWKNPDGTTSRSRFIAHSTEPGTIYWRDADADQIPEGSTPAAKRPRTPEDMLSLVPAAGSINKALLLEKSQAKGFAKHAARETLAELVEAETLHEWRIPRPGVKAEIRIARNPQELTK